MIDTTEDILYNIKKHYYYFTPEYFKSITGYDIKEGLSHIENDTDALIYIKQTAIELLRYIQNIGPKGTGTKNTQRKYVIEYLIYENRNDEVDTFLELLEEMIKTDLEGQSQGLLRQSFVKGQILTQDDKKEIRFSPLFKEILNNSILGKRRLSVVVPTDVLSKRGVEY